MKTLTNIPFMLIRTLMRRTYVKLPIIRKSFFRIKLKNSLSLSNIASFSETNVSSLSIQAKTWCSFSWFVILGQFRCEGFNSGPLLLMLIASLCRDASNSCCCLVCELPIGLTMFVLLSIFKPPKWTTSPAKMLGIGGTSCGHRTSKDGLTYWFYFSVISERLN